MCEKQKLHDKNKFIWRSEYLVLQSKRSQPNKKTKTQIHKFHMFECFGSLWDHIVNLKLAETSYRQIADEEYFRMLVILKA